MKKLIIAAAAIAGFGTVAQAADTAPEQGYYVGGVYNLVSYKEDNLDTIKPKALAILAGWNFNKNIAVEGRLGFGAGSDAIQGVDVKVDSYFSALARGTLPVTDAFDVYGVIGLATGKLKASGFGVTVSESDTSFSYGVGGEVKFAGRSAVSLEFGRMFSGDGYDVDALSFGYRYHF